MGVGGISNVKINTKSYAKYKRIARFKIISHASIAVWLRPPLFWGGTLRRLVVGYRRFGISYRSYPQESRYLLALTDP